MVLEVKPIAENIDSESVPSNFTNQTVRRLSKASSDLLICVIMICLVILQLLLRET